MFDYASFDWLNRVIYPSLAAIILFLLYHGLMKRGRFFSDKQKIALFNLIKEIKIKYDSALKCIYLPVFLAFILLFLLTVLGLPLGSRSEPLCLAISTSAILAPINEEIVYRGFIFGVLIIPLLQLFNLTAKGKLKEWKFGRLSLALVLVGIVLQGILFGLVHGKGNMFAIIISGIAGGALFYFNGKNLLPSIIFHAAWNTMIILSNPFILC